MHKNNLLAQSLEQAIHQPLHRTQFYHDFYDATIFLVSHHDDHLTENTEIDWQSDADIQIQQIQINNEWFVPIFSSLENMKNHIEKPVYYLSFPAKELLLMLPNMNLYLDYGCTVSKPFSAEELLSISDGSIFHTAKETIINSNSETLLGEPTEYPTALANALLAWFPSQPSIQRAWLAMIYNPTDGLPPHTILALETNQPITELSHEISQLIQQTNIPNPPLDILPLGSGEAIESYFLEDTKPFYHQA